MPVIHKPVFTVKQSPNKKWRWRVSRNRPTEKGNKMENLITSTQFASNSNAERGFGDALDSMLLVAWERNDLIDALERTGLLVQLRGAL